MSRKTIDSSTTVDALCRRYVRGEFSSDELLNKLHTVAVQRHS